MHATGAKGDIGVAYATADLIAKGWEVLLPVSATSPFDLVAHRHSKFLRVQVKYCSAGVAGGFEVRLRRAWIGAKRTEWRRNTECDLVCAYCPDTRTCYYLKPEACPIKLRIVPTLSGQQKGINWALHYTEIPEAVLRAA